jgi:Icc-related predicted phosphoesterase
VLGLTEIKKIFFSTDIHGSEVCFKKFINAGKFYGVDVLILGGDITGKLMIAFIEQPDGNYKASYLGSENIVKRNEVEKTEKMLRDSGAYTFRTIPSEYEELNSDPGKSEKLFRELMMRRLREWLALAEERLKNSGIPMYMTGGNDDPYEIEEIIRGSSYVKDPEGDVVTMGDYELASTGYSNMTPWHCPRDIPEEEMGKKIDQMVQKVSNFSKCIFNFHTPPYDTSIDLAPELTEDLTPVLSRAGGFNMIHVGSKSVRSAIEKYQPFLGLHGHIHESRAYINIGKTVCVNPGSEYGEGVLRGALITPKKKGGIENPEFTYG